MSKRHRAKGTPESSPHQDPIRIVPLQPARIAEAAPTVRMTYRGGPLLTSVQVFTVFWGSAWKRSPHSHEAGRLNQFFDAILTSSLLDQLSEYAVTKYKIVHGKRIGTVTIATRAPGGSVTDSAIRKFLQQQIAGRRLPKGMPSTLFFVYVQPGVRVVMGGSAMPSCLIRAATGAAGAAMHSMR
jgi:hypothetical protein